MPPPESTKASPCPRSCDDDTRGAAGREGRQARRRLSLREQAAKLFTLIRRKDPNQALLAEQLAYYRAIAPDYEQYALAEPGDDELTAALDAFGVTGHDHAATLARPEPEAGSARTTRSHRLDRASLLRCVFEQDITRCPRCDGRLEVIACLTDPDVVGDILDHLGLLPGCPAATAIRLPAPVAIPAPFFLPAPTTASRARTHLTRAAGAQTAA